MKTRIVTTKKGLVINNSYEGEPMERKIAKMMEGNEPIGAEAPTMYTERKDGVLAETDIRTDRWDVAIEATEVIEKQRISKRENKEEVKNEQKSEETSSTHETPGNPA